jgi:hypothetical protein
MAKNLTFQVPSNPTGVYSIPVGVGGGGGTSMGDLSRTPPAWVDPSVLEHFIKDHVIEGQTVVVEHTYPGDIGDGHYKEDHIKQLLMDNLVREMFKANHIEFTRMQRHETNEMVFRARIHVVPDTQVRIIRELKDARKAT